MKKRCYQFSAIKKMLAIRKEIPAFADFNNRDLLEVNNPHLFVFVRHAQFPPLRRVVVVANFDTAPQHLNLQELGHGIIQHPGLVRDLYTGERPAMFKDDLVIPPRQFYWLAEY